MRICLQEIQESVFSPSGPKRKQPDRLPDSCRINALSVYVIGKPEYSTKNWSMSSQQVPRSVFFLSRDVCDFAKEVSVYNLFL